MSDKEIEARRNPINTLEDLSIGFVGRREWLVFLTDRFRTRFNLAMYENYKYKKLIGRIIEYIKLINSDYDTLYSQDIELVLTHLLEMITKVNKK